MCFLVKDCSSNAHSQLVDEENIEMFTQNEDEQEEYVEDIESIHTSPQWFD